MKNFRIVKLSKNVIILYWQISRYKTIELQWEFCIWERLGLSIEFYPKTVAHRIFAIDLCLGVFNALLSLQDNREWNYETNSFFDQ